MSPLAPFTLERFFARYEHVVPHMLSSSDCETLSVGDLYALEPGAEARMRDMRLGYADARGSLALRELIAARYETITPDEVLVHVGAQEALFTVVHAALKPGDHVIVQTPCYQSAYELPRSMGARISRWTYRPDRERVFSLDDFDSLLSNDTRLVAINSPNNPTGATFTDEEQAHIVGAADARGAVVLSDEVYRGLSQGHEARSAADLSPKAVSVGVLSKAFGLAGLRIGWIATKNRALLARAAEIKDFTSICAAGPAELLAEVALRHAESILAKNRGIVGDNVSRFGALVDRHADKLSFRAPEGGPVALSTFHDASIDIDTMAEKLVERGALIVPAHHFGVAGPTFRVGLGRADFDRGLEIFDHFLQAL